MNEKRKNVKLPDYSEGMEENFCEAKNERDRLDELWDGETVDEDKDNA